MPALTLAQLETALATPGGNSRNFIEPGTDFPDALNEVGPRVYALGNWPDLIAERTYLGADGYISLDRDIETVLAATINDRPATLRSQFHDVRLVGNTSVLPEVMGLIDNGYSPIKREIASIQNVTDEDDIAPVTTLYLCAANGTATTSASLISASSTCTFVGLSATGIKVTGTLDTSDTNAVITFSPGITWVDSIVSTAMPSLIELRTDIDEAETCVAELLTGTDVVRYRRYRVSNASDSTYVNVLAKLKWTNVSASTDIVYLGDLGVWKHALLAKIGEDNADYERSNYHWKRARETLEQMADNTRGQAKPVIQISPWGMPAYPCYNQF